MLRWYHHQLGLGTGLRISLCATATRLEPVCVGCGVWAIDWSCVLQSINTVQVVVYDGYPANAEDNRPIPYLYPTASYSVVTYTYARIEYSFVQVRSVPVVEGSSFVSVQHADTINTTCNVCEHARYQISCTGHNVCSSSTPVLVQQQQQVSYGMTKDMCPMYRTTTGGLLRV